MKYVYPLEPNADITEGLDDRVVDMLLNHRDKINKIVEVINSNFHLEEPESRLTTTEAQQIEMANDFRDILRPYHKEGEYYTATLKRVLFSPEKKEVECECCKFDDIGFQHEPQCPLYKEVEKEEPTREFTKEELTLLADLLFMIEDEHSGITPILSKIKRMLK